MKSKLANSVYFFGLLLVNICNIISLISVPSNRKGTLLIFFSFVLVIISIIALIKYYSEGEYIVRKTIFINITLIILSLEVLISFGSMQNQLKQMDTSNTAYTICIIIGVILLLSSVVCVIMDNNYCELLTSFNILLYLACVIILYSSNQLNLNSELSIIEILSLFISMIILFVSGDFGSYSGGSYKKYSFSNTYKNVTEKDTLSGETSKEYQERRNDYSSNFKL